MRIGPVVAGMSCLSLSLSPLVLADHRAVELRIRRSGAVLVPVQVDGRGPFTFLLDTGSSHTVVSDALAERLAAPAVARVRLLTPAGPLDAAVVALRGVSVGTARAESLAPSVVSLARLREREPGVDGILGLDFLSRFDFTVDYRARRLLWTAGGESADAVRVPLVRAGERSLVELPASGPREAARLVPDTGSEAFVIFERGGRTAVDVEEVGAPAEVSGLASRRGAREAVLRELRLGGITLRNQRAVVLARNGPREVEGDGLLPLHPFSRVSFSHSGGWLQVKR